MNADPYELLLGISTDYGHTNKADLSIAPNKQARDVLKGFTDSFVDVKEHAWFITGHAKSSAPSFTRHCRIHQIHIKFTIIPKHNLGKVNHFLQHSSHLGIDF